MDVTLFFVLPLIGGYAFVTRFLLLSYRTGRQEAQRLYYRAALYGVVLAICGAAIHLGTHAGNAGYAALTRRMADQVFLPLFEKERGPATQPVSPAAQGVRVDLAIICLYAFLLGALTPVWNMLLRLADRLWTQLARRRSFLRLLNLQAITDELERLLAESLSANTLILVTLSNDKVYVGTPLETLDPTSPAKYFKIQPLMSGYRSPTGQVEFTTFYYEILAAFQRDETKRAVVETFQLVIPIDKVLTTSGFDMQAYERFLNERGSDDELAEMSPSTPPESTADRAARLSLYASALQVLVTVLRLRR